jgi:hypothetical protein
MYNVLEQSKVISLSASLLLCALVKGINPIQDDFLSKDTLIC